jgi:hypothetical protein
MKVSEVQNMDRHVLRITLVLQHTVVVRAALESVVQLRQSNGVNRQAGMATLRNVGMRHSRILLSLQQGKLLSNLPRPKF